MNKLILLNVICKYKAKLLHNVFTSIILYKLGGYKKTMARFPGLNKKYKGYVAGCSVRRATHNDYEAVMDIDHNYGEGLDYLPFMYHSYIDNPRRLCQVCTKDNQIVGFELTFTVDSDQTMVNQAGRVKDSYKGLNISSHLVDCALLELQRKKYPIRRMLWTSRHEKASESMLRANANFKCTKRMLINVKTQISLPLLAKNSKFQKACLDFDLARIRLVPPRELGNLISSIEDITQYFSRGIVVLDVEPMRMAEENIDIITREFQCVIFASFDRSGVPVCISFGRFRQRKIGMQFAIDIYPKKTNYKEMAEMLVTSHILKHLSHEESQDQANIILQVSYTGSIQSDTVIGVLNAILTEELGVQLQTNTQFIFEYELGSVQSNL